MRLTALCVHGTLLAFLSLSWTIVDSGEGDIVGAKGFGPCAATLQSEGLCREGQDESTCPYLFSLPPLTVHLPKQLGELEKIMKDLQKLKDNVDQLRKMCADCTVSQTERECGRQFEREHVKLNEGSDAHEDESNWVNERNFRQECGTDGVRVENTMEGDGNTDSEKGTILEERERKKWEAERESDKGAVKENEKAETLKKVAENDGKTQTEGARGKDKLGQSEKPTAGGNERIVDTMRGKVAEKNNRDTGRETDKEKDRKWDWKGDRDEKLENGKERETATHTKIKEKTEESDHHMRRDETKETDKKSQTEEDRDSDGTKMSEDHSKHTNKEQEQPKKDRKKKTEKTIKVEQNNEKLKQTESIRRAGKETTVKEGEEEEEGRETGRRLKPEGGKMVQSVLRDSDGELTSNKATETTDFVSVSPTPQSSLSLAPEPDSMNSNKGTISTSSPPLSSSHLFTDANQGMIMPANGPPTPSTGDKETGLRVISRPTTTTTATFILTSTTSPRPGADFKDQVSSTTASTTTITKSQTLNTTAFLGERDGSRWTAKKNISSNTKMVMKPLPGLEGKLGETHKPGINPERDQNLKIPQNDRKQTKPNQKQKPSYPKPPSDQKPKSGKGPQQVHIPKPEQRAPPDNLTTDQNLTNKTNKLISKHDQKLTTEPNNLIDQQPKSHQTSIPAVQRPTSNQRAVSVNTTVSGTDPESAEIPNGNQNSKPEKRLRHPLQTNKPNQKQKPEKKPKSEEKTKHDQRSELKQYFTPVQESESESEIQTFVTELMGNSDENPSPEPKSDIDSTAGEKPTLDRIDLPPDQKPEPSQEIPTLNQTPTHGHVAKHDQKPQEPTTDQRIKTNVKPKPGKLPQTNQGLKTPWPGQLPKLNPKSVPDQIPEVDSDKTPKPRPPPAHRPPNRPTFKPGATSVQRLKPAVQLRPSSKTKTDLDPHISGTTSDGIQNSQTGMSPTSGPIKQTAVTPGAKTSSSQETQSFPLLDTLPQGFTMNPNSRTTSDLRPQTAGQPSSIPMTTRPNKISRGILPSVMPSTSPGSTKLNLAPHTDTSLQEQIVNNVEETAAPTQTSDPGKMMIPVTSPSPQTTSTLSPDLRSTTPATSGLKPPAAESPTPSTRELRVKINQVAAFLNNSLNPNGPSLDRRPKEHREYSQGGSRPDPRLPTHIPVKVTAVKRDCSDHLHQGQTKSGVYLVTPDIRSKSFPVFCDMELDGGGWTLLQRRQDGSVSFNRTWAEYRSGFGELDGGEFWLGNNMIHLLTRDRDMTLRVELEDFDGVMEYAEYRQFKVASERLRYRLTVGGYSGTAGDALRFSKSYDHNNRPFTTPDKDNDRYPSGNCGAYYSSGWWFDACMAANLNGRYYVGKYTGVRDGIFWGTWHNISTEYYPTSDRRSFKRVRMMIRPKGLAPGL